ncbi:MAG: bdhA 2 [Clostridia bacterium]|jgi:alcohol dehydrogenase YqhD (iron-dependent ADH family)|nr:bdhA 2 [Clostridia bacterium]
MNNFEFYSPTKVIFGKNVENNVGAEVKAWGGTKVLVHFGGSSAKTSGLLETAEASLRAAGIDYVLLGGVVPNPRLALVNEGIALCRSEGVDFILAVGGGSVIDSAKAIALGVKYDGDVWDFYDGLAEPKAALPTANILTLAAAGSETSEHTVITNENGWIKKGYGHTLCRPKFTMMNPELTYTLPAYQTACGIVDIMMHTLDRYFSPGGCNEMTDRIAEDVLKTVIQFGRIAMKNPVSYDARSEIMWAGSLSHNDLTGLGRAGDWAPHQLEHELSGYFDVAHGAGLAAVWGAWARYVYKADIMRFVRYGMNVWGLPMNYENPEETALEAIRVTEEYFTSIGMPITITELVGKEISDEVIAELTEKCTFFGTRTIGGLVILDKAEIADIYKAAR